MDFIPGSTATSSTIEERAATLMEAITALPGGRLAMDSTAAEAILGADYEATATELGALNAAITAGVVTGLDPAALADHDIIDVPAAPAEGAGRYSTTKAAQRGLRRPLGASLRTPVYLGL